MRVFDWLPFLLLLGKAMGDSGDDEVPEEVTGVLHESVSLPLEIAPIEEVESITWLSHGSLAILVPGGKGHPPTITVTNPRYEGRVDFGEPSGYSLRIHNLSREDEGSFQAQVKLSGTQPTLWQSFQLRIYQRLSETQIKVSFEISEDGTCNATLICSVEKADLKTIITWMTPVGVVDSAQEGPVLSMSWRSGDKAISYVCCASNPVSSVNSRPISVGPFCSGSDDHSEQAMGPICLVAKGCLLLLLLAVLALGLCRIWRLRSKSTQFLGVKKLQRNQMKLEKMGQHYSDPV